MAIPTFNRPDYISETLSSVLAQDYPCLDILVSDNGSRDETPELAQALIKNDPRARFRRNSATVSAHQHLTQCLRAARGEFFVLLCDDDRINLRFVSEVVAVVARHPEVSVVVPANVTIDERGTVIETFSTPDAEVFDGPEFICRWLYGRGPKLFANVVTVLARTAVLRRFGGYQGFARGRNNDNLIFLQCAISAPVGFAHAAVFYWRIHQRSYGSGVTPKELAESSRHFVRHLQCDPETVDALKGLPIARRKEIVDGVRYMTARELVFQIGFLQKSILREVLSKGVPWHRLDFMFWLVVLQRYYYNSRRLLRSLGVRTSGI